MKLYVTSHGEYSDWHIVAIFSDKEKAEKFNADMLLNSNNIEEWELDKVPDSPVGLFPFEVHMKYDGTALKVLRADIDGFEEGYYINDWGNSKEINILRNEVWAKDDKHAVKITNEQRARLIANHKWEADKIAIEKANKLGNLFPKNRKHIPDPDSSSSSED